jgi:uncharacterized protein (DUF2249 family)
MIINIQTKISDIIQENEKAIDVIASINSHFRKLKNPILRKLLASKVTLGQAARIGNVSNETILNKLKEIGFQVGNSPLEKEIDTEHTHIEIDTENLITIDVRPYIESGSDPFSIIIKEIKKLGADQTLLIINSFEPVPLIKLLESQGINSLVYKESEDLYKTYFQKGIKPETTNTAEPIEYSYTALLEELDGKLTEVDVREMEMPYPMITILNELAELESGHGLLVHHKRVPQFLLPKLDEQKAKYAMHQVEDDYVKMIITKN